MPAGRPPRTDGPYANVGRESYSVYLAGLSDGMVKVGYSDNPRTRLQTVAAEARRKFGATLQQFHIYPGIGKLFDARWPSHGGRKAEAMCIAALCRLAVARVPSVEYFDGLTFDAAKAALDPILKR